MEGLPPSVLVQAIAGAIDEWALGAFAVVAFVLLERRCTRASHWGCVLRVLGTAAAAAILAALTPNLFEPRGPRPDALELPSRSAAAVAAVAVVLFGHYGYRALAFGLAVPVAAGAWLIAGTASASAISTGLLIGSGTGMLVLTLAGFVRGAERPPGTDEPPTR